MYAQKLFIGAFLLFLIFPLISQDNSSDNNKNEQISIKEFLVILSEKRDLHVLYESNIIPEIYINRQLVDSSLENESLLNSIFLKHGIKAEEISDKTYVLRKVEILSQLSGKIIQEQNRPLVGATIQIIGSNKGAVSDVHGNFNLSLVPGNIKLEVRYLGRITQSKTIDLLPGDSSFITIQLPEFGNLDEVVVIGSRLSNTSLLSVTAPTELVHTKDQRFDANYGFSELLMDEVASFNSTNQTISDGSDHVDPITLKGLGPDQLLVLVNGKRRHISALLNVNGGVGRGTVGIDINSIPISAVQTIEIVNDGESAQYGSDAIAGVLNLKLREEKNSTEFLAKTGLSSEGDGLLSQFAFNTGFGFKNPKAFMNLSLEYVNRESFNRAGDYTGNIFGDERDNALEEKEEFFASIPFKGKRVMEIGNASISEGMFFLNSKFPFTKTASFYLFGGVSHRLGLSRGFYRFPFEQAKQSGIHDIGFSPELITNIGNQSITFGLEQNRNDWKFDVSTSVGRNRILFKVENSNNASLGKTSPTSTIAGSFTNWMNVTNFDVQKELELGFPANVGLGAEFKLENYSQNAGDEDSWRDYGLVEDGIQKQGGFQMFPGFRPENEISRFRTNASFYLHLEMDPIKNLHIGGIIRDDLFEGIGHRVSYKLFTRYMIAKHHVLRASFNTGFRAPSMPQIYYSSQSTQYFSTGDGQSGDLVGHFNSESNVFEQLKLPSLKPETSSNYNIGYSGVFTKYLSMTLDGYYIDIDDRILITGRFSANQDSSIASIFEPLGIAHGQFFTNAIGTITKGISMGFTFKKSVGIGMLKLSVKGHFSNTSLKKNSQGEYIENLDGGLSQYTDNLFNREERGRIEYSQPSNKLILSAKYDRKNLGLKLSTTHYGSVKYIHPLDGNEDNWVINEFTGAVESRDQTFNSKWVTDAQINYRLGDHVTVAIGGSNIFNIYPERHLHSANTLEGNFTYSRRVQQFGIRGAFYYFTLGLRL